MCDYTQVEYACRHLRYTVRHWCTKYQETHKRCPANVVAIEYRIDEKCGDCKDTSTTKYDLKKVSAGKDNTDGGSAGSSSQATGSSSG